MKKIAIVYWSGTGNTKIMADLVAEGARTVTSMVDIFTAGAFSPAKAAEYDAIAFGCPSMGSEQLEESEFEPMFAELESSLADKPLGLFGSYGWGDGEWMRSWEARCAKNGAILKAPGVISNYEPDADVAVACKQLGRSLAE